LIAANASHSVEFDKEDQNGGRKAPTDAKVRKCAERWIDDAKILASYVYS
jgi:hypothetical protein